MKISNHRINIKTLTMADLGWSSTSHQTHLGLSKNFMHNWDKHQGMDGFLAIKDFGFEPVSIYTGPIERKSGRIDAPNIKTRPNSSLLRRHDNPSVINRIRQAGSMISKYLNTDKILFIFCFNEKNKPVIILSELEEEMLINIKNNTDIVNNDNTISLKLINNKDESFNYIRNLAQFYSEIIEAGLSFEDNINLINEGVFDFKNIEDARKKINQSIVIRQGQSKFRNKLLENYSYKCAISECDVISTLEACHIYPYMGPLTNNLSNGIILRSDLHTLYDRKKICIDKNYKVILSDELLISDFYKIFNNKTINIPNNKNYVPNLTSINFNYKEFKNEQ